MMMSRQASRAMARARVALRAPASRPFSDKPAGVPSSVSKDAHQILLEDDPALKHYKSTKETARKIRRFGDVLTIIVGAGCVYQIYDVTQKRREERLGHSKS